MRKPFSCEGCRALEMLQGGEHRCLLGFKYDAKFRPTEPCPKPRTVKKFVELSKNQWLVDNMNGVS